MNILMSTMNMSPAGVPTYTVTLARELERRGHHVTVYSPDGGKLASRCRTITSLVNVATPDIIIARHHPCAATLKQHYPKTPFIFASHGVSPQVDHPIGINADRYHVINEQVAQNLLRNYKIPIDRIDLVRDFIDPDEFKPTIPLRSTPRVLFLSNYKRWTNYHLLRDACAQLHWDLWCVGSPYGRHTNIPNVINEADIVVSWGRGILEGMACGRAVVSYDRLTDTPCVGDGYITPTNFRDSRSRNFGPIGCALTFTTVDDVVQQLQKYNPEDGEQNRQLLDPDHLLSTGVNRILTSINRTLNMHGMIS